MNEEHTGDRFDRLPATAADRTVEGRATRREVLEYFEERFGIAQDTFADHTFWEKGKGKIWAFRGAFTDPVPVEALGIHLLRTRQRFWKPTTDGIQLFGHAVTRNRVELSETTACRFWRGDSQPVPGHDDPGYVLVVSRIGGELAPLGIGLWVDGELRSMVPKSRRRNLAPPG